MKLIKCVIRQTKLDAVQQALDKASLAGMTVTEVSGHGRQKGRKTVYRGREYEVSLLPKMMVEMVVPDEVVDEVVEIVMQSARTGDVGDGRIFVMPIEGAHNIRTGEPDFP